MTIPALEKGAERPREELTCTLYYLVNTVSEEVRENGFAMILDGRGYSWQSVKQTLKMLQVCTSPPNFATIVATPPFGFAGLSTQPDTCSVRHTTRRTVLASPG